MVKKNIQQKHTTKDISKKVVSAEKNLEGIAKGVHIPSNEKEVIEELVSELKISDDYVKIEKKLKKQKIDEEDALSLGVHPDKYHSAKEKEDSDNEHGRNFEESSGTFSHNVR